MTLPASERAPGTVQRQVGTGERGSVLATRARFPGLRAAGELVGLALAVAGGTVVLAEVVSAVLRAMR